MAVIKGWKFPVQVDENTGKIKTVEDNENIKQSVRMILETHPYERKIVENFGTDLRPFMFEVISPRVISDLKDKV
ncbi:MAG: GPW/gp25 family protein, partial [Acutalibacteraceae bacterium]